MSSLRSHLRERPLWLLGTLVILFFHRPLTTETFFFRDLYQLFYPGRLFLIHAVRNGEIPLWNPLVNGGQPFLVSPANAAFHPMNVIYFLLPPLTAFNLFVVLQFVLAGTGAYLLGRSTGLSSRAAFMTGSVYTFCGVALSTANLLPIACGIAWTPLVVCFVDRYLETSSRKYLAAGAVATGMILISGAAEVTGMTMIIVVAWVVAKRSALSLRARLIAALIVFCGAIGVSLILTVPAVEVIRESSRAQRRTYEGFVKWSVSPTRIPELFIPQFFGQTDKLDDTDYWGRAREDGGYPYLLSLYFGALPLLLTLAPGSGRIPRRTLAYVALCGIVLALGRALPVFRILYEFPMISIFRYPVKAMLLSILPVAILCGDAMDGLTSDRSGGRRVIIATAASASIMLLVAAAFSASAPFRTSFAHLFFDTVLDGSRAAVLASRMWHTVAVLVGGAGALFLLARRPREGATLLTAIIVLDLVVSGSPVNTYAPRAFYAPPAVAEPVRRIAGDGRFYHGPGPTGVNLRAPSNDIAWYSRWQIDHLNGYTSSMFGIPATFHGDYDGLAPKRMSSLSNAVQTLPWPRRLPILEAGGVRAFIAFELVRSPDTRLLAGIESAEEHAAYLYAIPTAAPARFVSRAQFVSSADESLRTMLAACNRDDVILETPASVNGDCGSRSVSIASRSLNRIRYVVDAPCAGYVSFAENWYPGWRATIDGQQRPLLRANYAFSAVAVDRGRHVIERRYEPRLPYAGAIGSFASLIALIVFARRTSTSSRSGE